jgi:nucleoside-triphosphatase THEP1
VSQQATEPLDGAETAQEPVAEQPVAQEPGQRQLAVERVPWSVLGPEFAAVWGRADPRQPEPEHVEIIGMNGSGKTYLLMKLLQDRMLVRNSHIILVVTKRSDKVFAKLGWPIVKEIRDLRKYRQCIYWPQTNLLGRQRRAFHEVRIREFLSRYWIPDSNRVIAFDEIAYVESLSPDVRELVAMYWREGRSNGITVVAMKQRPQGVQRDMSSETWWTFAFVPKDHADAERFAELFGNRREWLPVFEQMNPDNHEFLVRHTRTRQAYISWIDEPLKPIPPRNNDSSGIGMYRQG